MFKIKITIKWPQLESKPQPLSWEKSELSESNEINELRVF